MSTLTSMQDNFVNKYEIKNLDDLKIPPRIKKILMDNIDSYYRFCFYSTPGTGKTTTAKLLARSRKLEVKYLSGSNEFNAAVMRNVVYPFCNSYSVNGKEKILIVDEAENISNKIQDAFKILMDSAKNVRFIFITNEIEKMNDAILSRCKARINYNYTDSELEEQKGIYLMYALEICQKEDIKFTKDGLRELLKQYFPDFRSLLNVLEIFKTTNKAVTPENLSLNNIVNGTQNLEIYDLIENPQLYDSRKFYEIVSQYKGLEQSVLESLCEPYFQYLNSKGLYEKTLETAEIVNQYCVDYEKTMNKFGLLVSCLYKLRKNYI